MCLSHCPPCAQVDDATCLCPPSDCQGDAQERSPSALLMTLPTWYSVSMSDVTCPGGYVVVRWMESRRRQRLDKWSIDAHCEYNKSGEVVRDSCLHNDDVKVSLQLNPINFVAIGCCRSADLCQLPWTNSVGVEVQEVVWKPER